MMDHFVRRMNLDGYERDFAPLESSGQADRRGVINEAANRLFSKIVRRALENEEATKEDVDASILEACLYVSGKDADIEFGSASRDEIREVTDLANRLRHWFASSVKTVSEITLAPSFRGYGRISHCQGDFVIPAGLVEIKSGDRMFRSVDYRQLSVYAALSFAQSNEIYENLMLVNPRVGVSVIVPTNEFAQEVAGTSAVELFNSLLNAFSAQLVSL